MTAASGFSGAFSSGLLEHALNPTSAPPATSVSALPQNVILASSSPASDARSLFPSIDSVEFDDNISSARFGDELIGNRTAGRHES